MTGIQEVKELITFLCLLFGGVVRALKDGIDLSDIGHLTPAMKAALPAFEGIGKVGTELADLDDAERDEIIALVAEKLDLPDDRVEEFAEKLFRIAVYIVDAVQDGVEIFGKKNESGE